MLSGGVTCHHRDRQPLRQQSRRPRAPIVASDLPQSRCGGQCCALSPSRGGALPRARLIRRASHASHATADIRCRLVATTAVPSVCRRSVFASSPGSALSQAPTDLHSWDRRCGLPRSCVALLFPSACGRREHRRAVQLAVRIACLSPLSPQHAGPAAATAPLAGRLPTSNGPPLPCAAVLCRVVPSPLRVDTTGTAALSTPRCPRRAACFRCPPNTQAPPSPSSVTRPPLCGVTNAWVNPQ